MTNKLNGLSTNGHRLLTDAVNLKLAALQCEYKEISGDDLRIAALDDVKSDIADCRYILAQLRNMKESGSV